MKGFCRLGKVFMDVKLTEQALPCRLTGGLTDTAAEPATPASSSTTAKPTVDHVAAQPVAQNGS